MAVNDPLNDRQAKTGSFEFIDGVQALKNAKQFVDVTHVEPHAIIPNKEHVLIAASAKADFDNGGIFSSSEFQGVRKQIDKYLAEEHTVTQGRRKFADPDLDFAFRFCALHFDDRILR